MVIKIKITQNYLQSSNYTRIMQYDLLMFFGV